MTVHMAAAEAAQRLKDQTERMLALPETTLATQWAAAWETLEAAFADAIRAAQDPTTGAAPGWRILQTNRTHEALQHAREKLEELLAEYAGITADITIPDAINSALDAHARMVKTQLPLTYALSHTLNTITPEEIDWMVHRTTQRITTHTLRLPEEIETKLKHALIRGTATGENPEETARQLLKQVGDTFKGGLPRATMIARTETHDAQRHATQQWEKSNTDILEGWVWVAALDKRTCPACIAMHGTTHPTTEPGPNDHNRGRCTRVPKTKPWAQLGINQTDTAPKIQTGEEWYRSLTPQAQADILGAQRAHLINTGQIPFTALAQRTTNPGWRDTITQRPLRDLKQKAKNA